MPGPKPTASWEPHAIIDWYELEVAWWKMEAKKGKYAKIQLVLIGLSTGLLGAALVSALLR